MKLFKNVVYPTTAAVFKMIASGNVIPVDTTLDAVLAEAQDLTVIEPPHNTETQKTVFDGGVLDANAMTYTLAVIDREHYARIGDRKTVQEISENPDEYRTWVKIPNNLVKHIVAGWLYDADTTVFYPPTLDAFKTQLQHAAVSMAEDARQAIARPAGMTEIGAWAMNYANVVLHLAGLPTPLWDAALKIETAQTGETVAALRAVHIQRAQDFHMLSALTQGMKRTATAAFAAGADVPALVAESDALRADAVAAQADPHAAIAVLLG